MSRVWETGGGESRPGPKAGRVRYAVTHPCPRVAVPHAKSPVRTRAAGYPAVRPYGAARRAGRERRAYDGPVDTTDGTGSARAAREAVPAPAPGPSAPADGPGDRPDQGPVGESGGRAARRVRALLGACHPGPAAAVTLLTAGLAVAAGQDAGGCALATAAVAAGQLSVGWSNDAVDAARDTAVGRDAKPVAGGAVTARTVRCAALAALALCVPLSLAYGALAGAAHLVGVAAAWAYNLRLKSTVFSWLPYALGFASLPAFVALGLPGRAWPGWWTVTAAALLGVGAHLGNVLPDIEDDLATGVRGWPQRLGPAAVRVLLPAPLVAATLLLALGPPGAPDGAAVVAVAVAPAVAVGGALLGRDRPRVPFLAAIVVAGVNVGLLWWQAAATS